MNTNRMNHRIVFLAVVALVAVLPLAGCSAPGRGPYFRPSHHGVHAQRDRIYNPSDFRYYDRLSADSADSAD